MKYNLFFCSAILLITSFVTPLRSIFSGELLSNEVRQAQYVKVCNLIKGKDADTTAVNREIKQLEKMYEASPDFYVAAMSQVVRVLFRENRDNDNKWSLLLETLTKRILSKFPQDSGNKGYQINIIFNCMPLDPEDSPKRTTANRTIRVSKILELWYVVSATIEADWDFNDPKNILEPYSPPNSYQGGFKVGMSPQGITDEEVKKEYTEYLEKREALAEKSIEQKRAKDVVREDKDGVKKYIIDSYSIHPFATAELETLLTKYKVEKAFAKEILDAVKQAEKDALPLSDFRTWQSKDKLFKTTAKFISLDKGNVTIEKSDGKRVTIELDAFRDVDQRFVKDQLTAKPAVPVTMRMWTSSGGKYHIRAEYVSADENQVILKNEDGKIFPVALPKLSTDDQNYVKEQLKLEAKPELPKREK
jgi:hypothetical protein